MSAKTHLDSTNKFSGTTIIQIHFLEIPSGDYPKLLQRLLKFSVFPGNRTGFVSQSSLFHYVI